MLLHYNLGMSYIININDGLVYRYLKFEVILQE